MKVIGACTSLIVVSLSAASVLIAKRRWKRQHSAWVKQYPAKSEIWSTDHPAAGTGWQWGYQVPPVPSHEQGLLPRTTGTCGASHCHTDYKVQVLYCDILAIYSCISQQFAADHASNFVTLIHDAVTSQKVGSRLVGWVVSKFHQSSLSKTCFRPAVGSKVC